MGRSAPDPAPKADGDPDHALDQDEARQRKIKPDIFVLDGNIPGEFPEPCKKGGEAPKEESHQGDHQPQGEQEFSDLSRSHGSYVSMNS
jgi:hypothetical protein